MPVLARGLRTTREITFTEYYQVTFLRCKPGCECGIDHEKDKRMLIAAKRKTNLPEIMREPATDTAMV